MRIACVITFYDLPASFKFHGWTSQRLLIMVHDRPTSVRSFDPTMLAPIQRIDRPDGTGDLMFPDRTLLPARS